MPALRSTFCQGEIIFLGVQPPGAAQSVPVGRLVLGFDGAEGDTRSGRLRASDERVSDQHPLGTPIANTRQLVILSQEELAEIAFAMRIPGLQPEWLGASIVLRGLPDVTHLPPSARLQGPDGATLVIDMEDRATAEPAAAIEAAFPEAGARFRPAAHNRKGVTAWVERPGILEPGQMLTLHIPDQRPWQRMRDVRG
ncbi:MOSC domain-containing protein [Paenirhodobacter enshiensis]|uniref:MOSC domain-containing protein n=1 Tax=Paenirhodobacter enshiensis TaxID=1105367 RepID=UPI0035B3ABC2